MVFEMNGVQVNCAEGITEQEASVYVNDQLHVMPHKTLLAVDLAVDGTDVVITPHYDSIVRVRRITGYLSTLPRFNDAKKKEAADRVAHI
ncbi:MAG: anaerobic ribonucleoside-triphosphate reductase [Acidaminococcaceae bacterium]